MAKYDTTLIRNPRQEALLTALQGSELYLCSGTPGASLAIPVAGSILSQHAVGASAGSVANGTLSLSDADVAEDPSANNSGTITYVLAVKDSAAIARWLVPSQMSVSINGGSSLVVTAGLPVDVDSMSVNEGNA